ncbi:hypothetical protein C5E51_35405 [Nocardia nova]|uniref:hypothetical protein n=1 Tax=Nocardia nova TaxID=37330 RepID=UPI000CEA2D63|nr:hypothetical protein [Nocardia nova]PPJ00185.1 hypothetical protein C5E51_35405 [Nocardia nova]
MQRSQDFRDVALSGVLPAVIWPVAWSRSMRITPPTAVVFVTTIGSGQPKGKLQVDRKVRRTPWATIYATSILPGWLIGAAGLGFALPAIPSSATADLPCVRIPRRTAFVNMSRQIGTALGVGVLGTPIGYGMALNGFQHAWGFSSAPQRLASPLHWACARRLNTMPCTPR